MTTTVTKESLAARIADLEYGPRSLKEDYTLAAYKMLLATMGAEPVAWTSERALVDVAYDETSMMGPKGDVGDIALYRHAQPAPTDSDPVVDMFVAEVVKNLVDALSGPMILGPIHVSSVTDHAKIGAKVAEVLALRYPMFIFNDVSANGFVEIRINQK